MRDPTEGLTATGTIVTGARRDRVPAPFEPVLARAGSAVRAAYPSGSLYVYGSVATGQAELARSDVDLVTIGIADEVAAVIGAELSEVFGDICRGVEIAGAQPGDFKGSSDEAYGNRVFLRHYCVHVAGPVYPVDLAGFPGDARAVRGFNGDIAQHAQRWHTDLDATASNTCDLARRVARKTLLAVAGLVSVHDRTWTTDRSAAALRWAQIEPLTATGMEQLLGWTDAVADVSASTVRETLDDTIQSVITAFASAVGLWP